MAKYRKKPIIVEAVQVNRKFFENALEFIGTNVGEYNTGEFAEDGCYIEIPTLEGIMTADEGDWIIKGVKGEFYPCKDEIFQKTYTATSTCAKCGKTKGAAEFYADKNRKNGCHTYCIECTKINTKKNYIASGGAERSKEQARRWREANPRQNKSNKLKSAFGIDINEYERILTEQSGCCAICQKEPSNGKYLCVDHNHKTNVVRGLLCHWCNKALGFLADDPARLIKAALYLKPDIFKATYELVEK